MKIGKQLSSNYKLSYEFNLKLAEKVVDKELSLDDVKDIIDNDNEYYKWYEEFYLPLIKIKCDAEELKYFMSFGMAREINNATVKLTREIANTLQLYMNNWNKYISDELYSATKKLISPLKNPRKQFKSIDKFNTMFRKLLGISEDMSTLIKNRISTDTSLSSEERHSNRVLVLKEQSDNKDKMIETKEKINKLYVEAIKKDRLLFESIASAIVTSTQI